MEKEIPNQRKSYSILRMLYIFAVAPLIIYRRWSVGKDLSELQHEGFKIQFVQRFVLLLLGTVFWIVLILYGIDRADKKRMQLSPEEEVEILEWKKAHGYE